MTSSPRLMTPLGWVGLGVGLVALVGGIIWLGATHDADGQDLIENPGGVLVAVLGLLTTVVSVLGPSIRRIDRQVSNTHTVNLRDDLDIKHERLHRAIDNVAADVRGVKRDVGRNTDELAYMRRLFDGLAGRLDGLAGRVDVVEDTLTGKEKRP